MLLSLGQDAATSERSLAQHSSGLRFYHARGGPAKECFGSVAMRVVRGTAAHAFRANIQNTGLFYS